jgi:hypothetical protein
MREFRPRSNGRGDLVQCRAGKVCTHQTLWDTIHHHNWVLNLISEFSLPSMKVLVALLG